MSVCYLCGKVMITQNLYDQNPGVYPNPAISHDEHIIQNALYGRLKSPDILCLTCGTKLSEDVDANFNNFFAGFTEPIRHILAKKDHGSSKPKTLRGYVFKDDGTKMEVNVRDSKVLPLKPQYQYFPDKSEVEIYATEVVAKNYQNQVVKELKGQGVDTTNLKIKVVDDITHFGIVGTNFSEDVEDFNLKFKLGFNKIATGFAAMQGINRSDMPCTIDTTDNKLIFTTNVVPFFPFGIMDMLIEAFRISQEPEFPTHTLNLYTDSSFGKTKLVCYIDLFSTFQHYVILNHDYKGPSINKIFYQTIIKQEKPERNIRNTRMKFLLIVAQELGVKPEEMRGMSINEMYDHLEKVNRQFTVSYELDLNIYLKHIGPKAAINYFLKQKRYAGHLSKLEEEILKGIPELSQEDLLTVYQELERFEEENPSSFYRKVFIENDKSGTSYYLSSLAKMIELNNAKFEGFVSYGHNKFYTLMHFISSNDEAE